MRRAIGWRVGLLLLLDVFADARKGDDAVTNACVGSVVVVNADVFVIMRPSDNVREIGAIVCFLVEEESLVRCKGKCVC